MQRNDIETIVRRALAEDLPDITSEAIFDPGERGSAELLIKADGVVAGLDVARVVFELIDPSSVFTAHVADGAAVTRGDVAARVEASVIALLSGERTALNLMQRASGIATATHRYVDAVAGTAAKIYDTRKTAPGLRLLDKYAVRAGGGENHRMGLYDLFLVKNNHVDRAGSITAAVERIRGRRMPQPLMVEVRNLAELDEALSLGPDFILLDNMSTAEMRLAVQRNADRAGGPAGDRAVDRPVDRAVDRPPDQPGGRALLEASGGITLENVRQVAETGVDRISIGALTHSVTALDISLRIKREDR